MGSCWLKIVPASSGFYGWVSPLAGGKNQAFQESLKRKIPEVHVQGRPLNCKTGVKNIFYGEDGERCGVEQLALQYYAGEGGGWQGVHTESGIWLTIFGLLMWDVIFADIPNVFCTKFQTVPLDLETDSFYEVRKREIECVLEKIELGMGEEILITSWELHKGTSCRGVGGTGTLYRNSEQRWHALEALVLHQYAGIWLRIIGAGLAECLTYCCGASKTITEAKQSWLK